jgi:uncharacterized membrane-anchored protein
MGECEGSINRQDAHNQSRPAITQKNPKKTLMVQSSFLLTSRFHLFPAFSTFNKKRPPRKLGRR